MNWRRSEHRLPGVQSLLSIGPRYTVRGTRFLFLALLLAQPAALTGQVQIRLDDPARTWYSELHDGLQDGTPAADSVRRVLAERKPARLWKVARQAVAGEARWYDAALAFTRIAELRDAASFDSAAAWLQGIQDGSLVVSGDFDPGYLIPPLRAIQLEHARGSLGDLALLNQFLPRIPTGRYNFGDAWVFGRLGAGAADSVAQRFLATEDPALRTRYLTLLSYSTDTTLIPLLARIYVAPDSFGLPPRIGVRASDGLVWIGTRRAVEALLEAREAARSRGTYADRRLGANDPEFLVQDSVNAVARTGKWLTEWMAVLR